MNLRGAPKVATDGLDFNDPAGWGYCDYCAFEVAVFEGVRIEHRATRNGHDETTCPGSGLAPVKRKPYTAKARKIVRFVKEADRSRRRSYWLRERCRKREKRRERRISMTRVTMRVDGAIEEEP